MKLQTLFNSETQNYFENSSQKKKFIIFLWIFIGFMPIVLIGSVGSILRNSTSEYGYQNLNGSDEHLMTPVALALKHNTHLSNMGYNYGHHSKITSSGQEKHLYVSSFNTLAEIVYFFAPKQKIAQIENPELKQEAIMNYIDNFRYILALYYVVGWIAFLYVVFKYFGLVSSVACGLFFIISPLILATSIDTRTFGVGDLLPIAYVINFYPNIIKEFKWRNFFLFVLGLSIYFTIMINIGAISDFITFTWTMVYMCILFIEIYMIKSFSRHNIFHIVNRILILGLVPLIFAFPVILFEINQMALWYEEPNILEFIKQRSAETTNFSLFVHNNKFVANAPFSIGIMNTWKDWGYHFYRAFKSLFVQTELITPYIWLNNSFIPLSKLNIFPITVFLSQILIALAFLVGIYLNILSYLRNQAKKDQMLKILIFIGFAFVLYFAWFVAINIVSPRITSHVHMLRNAFAIYLSPLLIISISLLTQNILRKIRIEQD